MDLSPVDFKAVAAKGCFVYAYLREHDRTPYYIGFSSTSTRPLVPHACQLPAYNSLIVVLRSGLSEQDAFEWERYYIKRFGRKDVKNGLLLNRTDGGEGCTGRVCGQSTKEKISAAHVGKKLSDQQKERLRQASTGKKQSAETIAKRAAKLKGLRGAQPEMRKSALARGEQDRIETAKRWGLPAEEMTQMTTQAFASIRLWLYNNPRYNYQDRKAAIGIFGSTRKLSQMMENAEKCGLTWQEWAELSPKRRYNALKAAA
jgi:hypothetical protein